MAYIGANPVNGFFEKQQLTTDGSTTTFTLNTTIGSTSAILVVKDGVVQEPEEAYTLSGGGTSIVFASAPGGSTDTYIHFLGQAIVQNLTDMNGVELILDADADTSITADTDDEIDIQVGGADKSTIKTTGFHNIDSFKFVAGTGDDLQIYHDGSNSFIANSTGILKIATETSGIAVTIGHSTSEVTVADNMTVAGDLTVTGTASFGDTNITNVGSITLDTIANDGSDGVTIDSSTDVIIDAGGADIILKDDGTEFGRFTNNSTDFEIKVSTQDKDIKFIGDDGGSAITALSLDMSAAGDATFNNQVIVGDGKLVLNSTAVTSTAAELNALDGITSTVAELNIVDGDTSASAVTIVDADQIILNDAGTMKQVAVSALNTYTSSSIAADNVSSGSSAVTLTTSSGNITIDAAANDSDIILKGTDGGADTTFLTIDGSAAGAATFNGVVTANAGVSIDNITIDGTEIDLSSGDLTVDVAGDINLDAGGADILFKDDGTEIGRFSNSSSDFVIKSAVSDKDIIFKGNDSGSEITALTLDMSAAGEATFANNVRVDDNLKIMVGTGNDLQISHDGSNSIINAAGTGGLLIQNNTNNQIVSIQSDDASGGLTDYVKADGGEGEVLLYFYGSEKLKTVTGGVNVTGTLTTTAANVGQQAITSSSNAVAWDATAKPNAYHITTENTTFSAPSNAVEGAFICVEINYNGSHTIAWNTVFEFAASTAPTATSTDGKTDILVFRYNGAVWQEVGRTLNLSES